MAERKRPKCFGKFDEPACEHEVPLTFIPLSNEVQLDRGTAAESESEVMVWIWYNRQELVARLEADRVITHVRFLAPFPEPARSPPQLRSVPSTWHNFSQGFVRIVGNLLVDVGESARPASKAKHRSPAPRRSQLGRRTHDGGPDQVRLHG
jgi:hypothetical protein